MESTKLQVLVTRLEEEQRQYKEYLLTLTPEEILDHAREFTQREEIIYNTSQMDCLREDLIDAILKLEKPLAEAYEYYRYGLNTDDYIGDIFVVLTGGDPEKEWCNDKQMVREKYGLPNRE